jgi:ribokinase
MKTLVYGSLNIDLVFSVDHIVIPGETISSSSFFKKAGGNSKVSREEIEQCLSFFGKGDLVMLQNEISNTGLIMKMAKGRGMKVVLNPSPWNEGAGSLPLELADILFVDEVF